MNSTDGNISHMEKEFIDRILKLTREQRELLLEYALHMLEEAEM